MSKRRKINLGEDVEKRKHLYTVWWEGKLVQSLQKTVWTFLKKFKIELPYDPAIPLLEMYLKKTKTLARKDTCIPMHIAALLKIVETWNLCMFINR